MAAVLRRDLDVPVEMTAGHYGEFTVFVEGREIVTAGPLAFAGVLPSIESIRDLVKQAMDAIGQEKLGQS